MAGAAMLCAVPAQPSGKLLHAAKLLLGFPSWLAGTPKAAHLCRQLLALFHKALRFFEVSFFILPDVGHTRFSAGRAGTSRHRANGGR